MISQNWFSNRRQKWKKEQKQGAVGSSGSHSVLSGEPLIQTSCKRSFNSTVSFHRLPQFPAQQHVPSQMLPSAPFLTTVPFALVSHHVTESFAACSSGTQQYPQQPLLVPGPRVATETGLLPCQQARPPFPVPVRHSQQAEASSYPAHQPLPSANPVKPEINYQVADTDPRCLADEFPFSYSIAKELPHIFGNLEEDEVLDRPPTPSFEPATERETSRDPMALESVQFRENPASLTREDLTVCTSPNRRHFDSSSFSSCSYDSSGMSAPPPLRDLSRGFISKERSFSSCRQD